MQYIKMFSVVFNIIIRIIFWSVGFLLHLWSALALYYCSFPSLGRNIRLTAAVLYIAAVFAFVIFGKKRKFRMFLSLIGFLVAALFFISIKPNPRAAYPQDLKAAYVEFEWPKITIHDVRDNDYRTSKDFDVRYEARTYDVEEICSLDVFVNYWGSDIVAHTFLSFGFSDGKFVAVSIEIRPQAGESYCMLGGLFKQYELIYIWSDERDIVRLRTNYRKEDVYLYRVKIDREDIKKLFISMLKRTNSLYNHPEFYNTLFHSCTNTISSHLNEEAIIKIPFWKRRFLTGDIDLRAYKDGRILGTNISFAELREISKINARAIAADKDEGFSENIRTHLSGCAIGKN